MNLHRCMSALALAVLSAVPGFAQQTLVGNGGFEDAGANGAPAGWSTSGAANIRQELSRDTGRDGKGFSATLACTEFADGSPSSHAMICQAGVASAQRGKWYRLSFWARSEGIRGGVVQVGLSNSRTWENTGISDGMTVRGDWRRHETTCQALADVPPEASRLQIWFRSTGTLWLDDVEMSQVDMRPQRHPQLRTEGRTNFLPNSSFECGAAG